MGDTIMSGDCEWSLSVNAAEADAGRRKRFADWFEEIYVDLVDLIVSCRCH